MDKNGTERTVVDDEFDEVVGALIATGSPGTADFFVAAGLEAESEGFAAAVEDFEGILRTTVIPPGYKLPQLVLEHARSVVAAILGEPEPTGKEEVGGADSSCLFTGQGRERE